MSTRKSLGNLLTRAVNRRQNWHDALAVFMAMVLTTVGIPILLSSVLGAATPASAAPGSPGTPGAPTVVYTEDFQNRTHGSNILLSQYTSTTGVKYTADPAWNSRSACNGLIVDWSSTQQASDCVGSTPGYNGAGNFAQVRGLAYALASLSGLPGPNNAALTAYTAGDPGANRIEFKTASPLNFSQPNRFVTFSVDAAAMNCGSNAPLLRFYLANGSGTEIPVSSSAINPCTQGHAIGGSGANPIMGGTFLANSNFLLTGSSFGVVLRNEQGSGAGNDGAIDNIRVLDVTPQLDKSFSPVSVPVGGTSTLTFTITNTSELAAKKGWSFKDTLPQGLVVANPARIGGTCSATKTAAAGGSTIAVTNGNLASNQKSCTVTVDVTSASPVGSDPSPKTYANGASNISSAVGISLPANSTMSFYSTPKLTVAKTSTATADTRPGDTVNYTVTGTSTGSGNYTKDNPAVVTDDLSGVVDDASLAATSPTVTVQNSSGAVDQALTQAGQLVYDSATHKLSWTGALPVGDKVVISYPVTVKDASSGNRDLYNIAYAGNGPTPSSCAQGDPTCATTDTKLPALTIDKTASSTSLPADGGAVTYTVKVTNTGPGDYSSAHPASFTDNLSSVLDDATYNGDASAPAGSAVSVSGSKLSWSGPLAAGASATVTYSVTYHANQGGDHKLINDACVPATQAASADGGCAAVQVPAAAYTAWKTVNPASGTTVQAGDTVTYTLYFKNTGAADAAINSTDDLSGVLDDATLSASAPVTSQGLSASVTGSTLSVTGNVPVGQTGTVTYTVTPKPYTAQGDHHLKNTIQSTNGGLVPPDRASTDNPVTSPAWAVSKSAAGGAAGGTGTPIQANPDGTATASYTVTVTNTGNGPGVHPQITDTVALPTGFTASSVKLGQVAQTLANGSSFTIPAGSDPVQPGGSVSYTVTVTATADFATVDWTKAGACGSGGGFVNTVTAAEDTDGAANNAACVPVAQPTQVIHVEKQSLNCDTTQPTCLLGGAAYALYSGDPSHGGSLIANGISPDTPGGAVFTSTKLVSPGDYWLVETTAPGKHQLLATPIKFALSPNGVQLDSSTNGLATVKAGNPLTIVVSDPTTGALPSAGGFGPWPYLGAGLLLFVLAGLSYLEISGRRITPRRALQ